MFKKTTVNNHTITRLFGTVRIDGQKTPLRFAEAVKAVSMPSKTEHWFSEWDRAAQEWVAGCLK